MKLLQINVNANWGSTGRIAEGIGCVAIESNLDSWIAYGRGNPISKSHLLRIGSDIDMRLHGLSTRLFDNHGLVSKYTTKKFLSKIEEISPDIIHLHNIHGYYLNYEILFDYLKRWGGPVVWTLHDCWAFTGHCAYYDYVQCDRWMTGCHTCPQKTNYPASYLLDRSEKNYHNKKEAFLGLKNLRLIPVSNWLGKELSKSFLSSYPRTIIHNGIDLSLFTPINNYIKNNRRHKIILGVASVWDKRKGLDEFIKLRNIIDDKYKIILVGLSQEQITTLPSGITGIKRTDSIQHLAKLYSIADVFVNPTLEDNFPTTNIEALACGTPVITYDIGGSPEAIDEKTGLVVPYKDITNLKDKIIYVCENHPFSADACRERTINNFNKDIVFSKYINLYKSMIGS